MILKSNNRNLSRCLCTKCSLISTHSKSSWLKTQKSSFISAISNTNQNKTRDKTRLVFFFFSTFKGLEGSITAEVSAALDWFASCWFRQNTTQKNNYTNPTGFKSILRSHTCPFARIENAATGLRDNKRIYTNDRWI